MTDFRERASVTVSETATIDAALEHMKHNGVRCAFAIDEARRAVAGLITAYDIMSEKPMRHMQAMASPRREVLVRDIMHGVPDWLVVDIKDVEQATVASVSRLFDETRLTHIPVTETGEHGEQRLRGLLSGARVRRLLAR
jgi:CBS domain-containing protein